MATVLVWKECRALAPVFAAAVVMLLATALVRHPDVTWLGMGVYILAAIALGALCVGHEFTYDTLGQMLALPSRRGRLWATKLAVLGAFLLTLAAGGALVLSSRLAELPIVGGADAVWLGRWIVIALPPLVAFSVAPWLTMLCRSTLAGVVFTLAAYATVWVGVRQFGVIYQDDATALAVSPTLMLPLLSVAACAAAAVLSGRTFTRLEAAGRFGGSDVTAPSLGRDGAATTSSTNRSASSALILKELRLQQTSFIVAGLYALGWALMPIVGRGAHESQYVFGGITALYQLLLAALIGALASAEERSFGTLLWQNLQPYSMSRQWAVKTGVVIALTVVLVAVLPNVLHAISPHAGELPFGLRFDRGLSYVMGSGTTWVLVLGLCLIGTLGLFVSSSSRSSIHALMLTGVIGALLATATSVAFQGSQSLAWTTFDLNTFWHGVAGLGRTSPLPFLDYADIYWTERATAVVTIAAVCIVAAMLTRFGLRNHRSAEPTRGIVARQTMWLLVASAGAAALIGGGEPLLLYFLATH